MCERKKMILAIARDMFYEYGIKSVSIDDICKKVSISKRTFYLHFCNKTALVKKILKCFVNEIRKEVKRIKRLNLNAIDDLLTFSFYLKKQLQTISKTMNYDLVKYFPKVSDKHNATIRNIAFNEVIINFKKGIKEGYYRKDLNLELVTHLYVQKLQDMQKEEHILSEKYPISKIHNVLFEQHIRGIANKKGIEYFENVVKNNLKNE